MSFARASLTRLLQLASPALPVGAYSYSQALEWAVEAGTIHDAGSAQGWIMDGLRHVVGHCEAPLWLQLYDVWQLDDVARARELNDWFIATRETAELRAETLQMGYSLARLLGELNEPCAVLLRDWPEVTFVAGFSCVCVEWRVERLAGLAAYLFAWVENQVAAALKAVPLGQVAGQKIVIAAHAVVEEVLVAAVERAEQNQLSTWAPGFAIASARHETQYSRLFRS